MPRPPPRPLDRIGKTEASASRLAFPTPRRMREWTAIRRGLFLRTACKDGEARTECRTSSLAPPTPTPTLPHKGGGLESDSLPPCGGGLGWGVLLAKQAGRRSSV